MVEHLGGKEREEKKRNNWPWFKVNDRECQKKPRNLQNIRNSEASGIRLCDECSANSRMLSVDCQYFNTRCLCRVDSLPGRMSNSVRMYHMFCLASSLHMLFAFRCGPGLTKRAVSCTLFNVECLSQAPSTCFEPLYTNMYHIGQSDDAVSHNALRLEICAANPICMCLCIRFLDTGLTF